MKKAAAKDPSKFECPPIRPFELTDAHWARITKIEKNIAQSARLEIGFALGNYQTKQGWNRTSLETKRSVIAAQKAAEKLERLLAALAGDTVYLQVGMAFQADLDALKTAQVNVDYIRSVLNAGRERMKVKRGRKSPKALEELIVHLMGICGANGGRVINRSTKKGSTTPYDPFIYACIEFLTPKIPRSRIDTQLRRVIGRYHAGLRGGYDMAKGKYIDR